MDHVAVPAAPVTVPLSPMFANEEQISVGELTATVAMGLIVSSTVSVTGLQLPRLPAFSTSVTVPAVMSPLPGVYVVKVLPGLLNVPSPVVVQLAVKFDGNTEPLNVADPVLQMVCPDAPAATVGEGE